MAWIRWVLTAVAVLGAGKPAAQAVTATFGVRLAPTETDAVLDLSDPGDQVLDLELWVTLSDGPLPAEGDVLAYSVYLEPTSGDVISFDPGSFVNVVSADLPQVQGEDNTPVSGAFSAAVGFLPPARFALGETRLGTFSVTAVGEGVVSYSFLDSPPMRPWSFDFADLTTATHLVEPPLAITVQAGGQPAHVAGWRSVREHGAAGDLAIALSGAGSGVGVKGPTVETRNGGIQKIRVVFDQPVTLADPAAVSVTGRTTVGGLPQEATPYSPSQVSLADPATLDIVFDAGLLPDQSCYTISLGPGTTSPPLTGDLDVTVRSLHGDVTGDGEVNLSDVLATRASLSMPVGDGPQFDVDLSGELSSADVVDVKGQITSPTRKVFCDDPATVTGWRSVRTHGAAGPLAIVLAAASGGNGPNGPTVEARAGGIQLLEIDFDRPVTLNNPGGVVIVGRTSGPAGLEAPVNYPPTAVALTGPDIVQISVDPGVLPDQTCYTITLPPDLVTAGLIGDRDVSLRSLAGDVTGDGALRLSDVLAVRARLSTPVEDDPRFDVDVSGAIDWPDAMAGKSRITSPFEQALCP